MLTWLSAEWHKFAIGLLAIDHLTLHWGERIDFWKGIFGKLKKQKQEKEVVKMNLVMLLQDVQKLPVIVPKIQTVIQDIEAIGQVTDPAVNKLIADVVDLKNTLEGMAPAAPVATAVPAVPPTPAS